MPEEESYSYYAFKNYFTNETFYLSGTIDQILMDDYIFWFLD
jgi:hypothetical protein